MTTRQCFFCLSLLLLASAAAKAETTTNLASGLLEGLQLHGFASQGALQTSANRFYGDSPNTSFDFTDLGLTASWRLNPRLLLSAQVLARRAGDMSNGWPRLDFALADINLATTDQYRAGLRLGRMKNRLGLYNETRDVPFTHPGIFLPQVVYFDKVRNLILATDGLALYGELYQPFGTLSATLSAGEPVIDKNVEAAIMIGDIPGKMENAGTSWLASLWYSSPDEHFKLGLSAADLALKQDWSLSPKTPRVDLLYWIASAQYNSERWSFSTEYMGLPIQWRDFLPLRPDYDQTSEGYYAQLTYRAKPRLELLLRYEEGYANRDDRKGRLLEQRTQGFVKGHVGSSKIKVLGLRWDISQHWMLKLEYQRHTGAFILSERENPDFSAFEKHWDLFAIQAAFRF